MESSGTGPNLGSAASTSGIWWVCDPFDPFDASCQDKLCKLTGRFLAESKASGCAGLEPDENTLGDKGWKIIDFEPFGESSDFERKA
mmetsp:Transcript_2066/g.3300  ORF Transcript_2066/g.3300 Transcript_2066/m.3300 type:complete len:87 (-) Transcript_2066:1161-1421(-)